MSRAGRDIYRRLTEAPDLTAAVESLTAPELTEVSQYISGLPGGGISAQVFGVVSARMERSGREGSAKRKGEKS